MKSIEIQKIRLMGIVGCIDEYTNEPSITNIKKTLANAINGNNFDVMLFACREVDVWYQKNIHDIESNDFVHNKGVHRENCKLIRVIISELETYKDTYKINMSIPSKGNNVIALTDSILVNIFNKFHQVVVQLRDRYNERSTLDIEDEYDVQDLLHVLLIMFCDDIRAEEWTPSYAGTSSRQDFLLRNEKIVIEVKKTRKGLDNRELGDQLIIDIARYKTHPESKKLVCFIYAPENRIKNPRGFENDLSNSTEDYSVLVYVRP